MRGGFVACAGAQPGGLEQAAERLRWHRGQAFFHHGSGIAIAGFRDVIEGPFAENRAGVTLFAHGGVPAPLAQHRERGRRFVAIECDGGLLRVSRDPIGLAPVFFRILGSSVWLATEAAPLLWLGNPGPDVDALVARAAFAPMDERTGWLGVHRVLPGSTLEVDLSTLATRSVRYWLPERLFGTYRGSYRAAVDEFGARFRSAVERCVDARYAILLSGGIDSAAVALTPPLQAPPLPAPHTPHLVHVHYADLPQTHEQQYAKEVALRAGAPLHVLPGETTPWDIDAELDMHGMPYNWLPYGMDEPPLAHIAAQGIGVALDGHDGDGVLGAPGRAIWGSLMLEGEVCRLVELTRKYGIRRAARGLAADFVPPMLRPRRTLRPTQMQLFAGYFKSPLSARIAQDDLHRWGRPRALWRARQLQPLLPRAVISFEQKEIEAARYGIDLRHPFADRELIEFLITLPCAIKSDPMRAKPVLVDALASVLPASIHSRRKSDYMAALRQRISPARCAQVIQTSNVRLPHIDYVRLFADCDVHAESIPLHFLVNLARLHHFARRVA